MFDDLLEQAAVLKEHGKPFVLATVVACKPPTSAKAGAKAIVQPDGSFYGWVGGSCAQPLVTQESLKALQDGQSRLVLLAPDPEDVDVGLEGTVLIPMACQSEGTLAIYLEPCLPKFRAGGDRSVANGPQSGCFGRQRGVSGIARATLPPSA